MGIKKDIRKCVLEKRYNFSNEEWQEKSNMIYEKLIKHAFFSDSEEIYCYVDFRKEVETRKIIEKAWQMNKKVAVPKISEEMHFYYISSWNDVAKGHWGILEPVTEQLAQGDNVCVIMPGAVFDFNKNRIGYGKGYYDSYLQSRPGYKTIALAFQLQMMEEIPAESHDICPQVIITEEKIYD